MADCWINLASKLYFVVLILVCRSPDFYHSCYCLSGLSVSQHNYTKINGIYHVLPEKYVYGDHGNLVEAIHPVYNISMDKVELIKKNLKK